MRAALGSSFSRARRFRSHATIQVIERVQIDAGGLTNLGFDIARDGQVEHETGDADRAGG
jgi:hypothetical protein